MKKNLITAILQCMAANNVYISGDTFFALCFRTEDELKAICRELHMNPEAL